MTTIDRRKLRDRLAALTDEIADARSVRTGCQADYDKAAERLAAAPEDPTAEAYREAAANARAAREALDAAGERLDALQETQIETIKLAERGRTGRPATLHSDDLSKPGAWLSRVCLAAATTAELGSTEDLDRIFIDRLTEASALMSTPGIQIADIDTTSVKVGKLTGRMDPATPVPELEPIPKDDVPIGDDEVAPPKWPKLVTLSLEAYRDARPLRLAAVEREMIRAIAEGFDTGAFHGAAGSAQVGLENVAGINAVPLSADPTNLDWIADGIGELLDDSAVPSVLYMSPYTVRALLKLKKGTDSNEPLVGNLLNEAADLLGVRPRVTNAIQAGHAFVVDPRCLLIVRRSDVETRVFEDYGFDNAEVGIRAIARMELVVAQPEGVAHVSGLPEPEAP